jgi:arylsulfatase A-like enzyme
MPLPAGQMTVAGLLRQAGYVTGHMQKRHEGSHSDAQFDWYDAGLEKLAVFLDLAARKPFFLWVAFDDPHRPYADHGIAVPHAPGHVDVPPYLADTPDTRADLAQYYDEISRMDAVIGQHLELLDRRGRARDTLVVFLSDNGAPFPREKGTVYDAGVRTPLVFRWPGVVPEGVRHGGLMSVIDLAPTLLELAGVGASIDMQGQSFGAGLRDPAAMRPRSAAFSERNWHDADEHIRSVRTDRHRLVHNAYVALPFGSPADVSGSPSWRALYARNASGALTKAQRLLFESPRPEIEFYDIERDPFEIDNLAPLPEYQAAIAGHFALLQEWRRATHDFPPERRRRAGYVDRVTGVLYSLDVPPMTDE